MKPLTKLYLKTFLLTGIPFGLMMIGFDLINGDGFSLSKFLFMTFFFGVAMSLFLVSFHRYRLKKNGVQEATDENLGVSQTRILMSKITKAELAKKIKADPIIGKFKMTEIEDAILLKTRMTWKSWGEDIQILQKPFGDSEFEYQITSSPRMKTTIVDYGKNTENLNRIEGVIMAD